MKKLPIGIQTFQKFREGHYCYVDKTPLIGKLAELDASYFLARPRRFGKSLLLDTLAEAFLGNREWFTGLWLEKNWDWSKQHPVVKIDFGGGGLRRQEDLTESITARIDAAAAEYGVALKPASYRLQFQELLTKLHEAAGERVVVLVDEYDKPILDNIETPEVGLEMREGLRDLYSVLKVQDAHLRFVMLTGVSKFSKVSLFSGLNNLNDITLDPAYATLCGYTQAEMESVFAEHLEGVDLKEVKRWYNGYRFLGESLYNPFDILLYLDKRRFQSYWFETGTPTFLLKMIHERRFPMPQIQEIEVTEEDLGVFDVDYIGLESLLFQTGYLTIVKDSFDMGEITYTLEYPNFEVRNSLPRAFLHFSVPDSAPRMPLSKSLKKALKENRPELLEAAFRAFFASIPNDWYRKNKLAEYEGYYSSLVYCAFASIGVDVIPEDVTNQGSLDLTVRWQDVVFILEFKMLESPADSGKALKQIRERNYAQKYRTPETSVSLIGMEFDRNERNLCGFELEKGV